MNTIRHLAALVVATMLTAGLIACGDNEDAPKAAGAAGDLRLTQDDLTTASTRKTYVGKVPGTDAYIGVDTAKGRATRTYLCDGTGDGRWLTGDEVTLMQDGDRFRGSVIVNGVRHDFEAVRSTGPAGVYLAGLADGSVRATWIVLPDGSRRGSVKKDGKPIAGEVSPEDGTAEIAGETTTIGSGGSLTPLSAHKQTLAELCKAYRDAILLNSRLALTYPRGSSDFRFHTAMVTNTIEAMQEAGC